MEDPESFSILVESISIVRDMLSYREVSGIVTDRRSNRPETRYKLKATPSSGRLFIGSYWITDDDGNVESYTPDTGYTDRFGNDARRRVTRIARLAYPWEMPIWGTHKAEWKPVDGYRKSATEIALVFDDTEDKGFRAEMTFDTAIRCVRSFSAFIPGRPETISLTQFVHIDRPAGPTPGLIDSAVVM